MLVDSVPVQGPLFRRRSLRGNLDPLKLWGEKLISAAF